MSTPIMEAIEGIGRSFKEFKKVNEQKMAEEALREGLRALDKRR